MKEELLRQHTIIQCLALGFRIYRTNFIPILILSATLLVPPIISSILNLEIEHILFFLTIRLTEAAMTLGIVVLMFQPIFPAIGILKGTRPRLVFGAIHVGILQFIFFLVGSMFAVLPLPLNAILFFCLIISIFAFALAQTIYIIEEERGFRALVASYRLAQTNMPKTIITIILLGTIKLFFFSALFLSFIPNIELNPSENEEVVTQMLTLLQNPEVLSALRWSQYLGYVMVYPFAAIVMVLLYFDLKLKHFTIEEVSLRSRIAYLLPDPVMTPSHSPENPEN
ncbi:MAG: hypothetical protein HQM14_16320 [SAR324 cluster bacterium]|nr:hypothetical protein [SAR324 cluster bacterium]